MNTLAQVNSYPNPALTIICYLVTAVECVVWLGFSIGKGEEESGLNVGPKFLFTLVSLACSYFIKEWLFPDSAYSSAVKPELFDCAVVGAVVAGISWAVYELWNSCNVYSQLISIFIISFFIYLLFSSVGHITDTNFAYYLIAIFVGGNTTYVFLKISRNEGSAKKPRK